MPGDTPAFYLDNFRLTDWLALYRIARHPGFYYRRFNERNAWVAWRALFYIVEAKLGQYFGTGRTAKTIREEGSGRLIGCVVQVYEDKATGQIETGTFVGVPYQGKKIGLKARLRFGEWCLENRPFEKLVTMAHPDNQASIRMLSHLGLKQTGFISAEEKKYFNRDGTPESRVVLSATSAEIGQALKLAREQGLYSSSIRVL